MFFISYDVHFDEVHWDNFKLKITPEDDFLMNVLYNQVIWGN